MDVGKPQVILGLYVDGCEQAACIGFDFMPVWMGCGRTALGNGLSILDGSVTVDFLDVGVMDLGRNRIIYKSISPVIEFLPARRVSKVQAVILKLCHALSENVGGCPKYASRAQHASQSKFL